ncbi:SGNH/GDSL hydrolase family protein [Williamsia herbipolensis]|uniref:SGNH/GDSL hydrolase family protein n=1 Tax=Williamsia herbipolensis TaxID=1603258 RepID=UPI0038B62873
MVLASVLLISACTETPPAADRADTTPAHRAASVLFYGDSLTVGTFATSDVATFRGIVTTAAIGPTTTIAKKGVRVGGFQRDHPWPPPGKQFDLVVFELGTYDVGNTDPTLYERAYELLAQSVVSLSPSAQLICLGPWRPASAAQAIATATEKACSVAGGKYIPLSPLFAVATNHAVAGEKTPTGVTDSFSPNDAGHRAIADAILRVVHFA